MSKLIQLNNLNNYRNNLIINEFTKLIKETKEVIDYYLPYKKSKESKENISKEEKYVNNLFFKLNAFEVSLQEIKKYNFVINNGNQLKKIKGIGEGTVRRINYILKNGHLETEYPMLSEIYKEKLQKEQLEQQEQQKKEQLEKEKVKLEQLEKEKVKLEQLEKEKVKLEEQKLKSLILIKTENENEIKTEHKTENEIKTEPKTENEIKTEPKTENEKSENEHENEEPKIEQSEITENTTDLEIEKDFLGGCLSSTFNTLNNLKGLFCSFYNDIYVNFNQELNLNS